MHDGQYPEHLIYNSSAYGPLSLAGSMVHSDFEPANAETSAYIDGWLDDLGLGKVTGKTRLKYLRCMSDVLMAARTTVTGTIAWPMGSDEYSSDPYGQDIARKVLTALKEAEHLVLVQKSSKTDRSARVYACNITVPENLRFKKHGLGPLVVVRSPKCRDVKTGKIVGGQRMGRRLFLPDIQVYEDQVRRINAQMLSEPLRGASGAEFVKCYRVFNDGNLDAGGRLYGHWQGINEDARLTMKIGGEPVCEIDLKASFLSIANALSSRPMVLDADPYRMISFVRGDNDPSGLKRKAAKALLSAFFFNKGNLTKFPKGKTKAKDQHGNKTGRVIPFKKQYQLTENVDFYMADIFRAFPFLCEAPKTGTVRGNIPTTGMRLMFLESQIIINTMLQLMDQGVTSYPVHDCLLVKISDKEVALNTLFSVMVTHLSYQPSVDIAYYNKEGTKIEELVTGQGSTRHTYPDLDDPFSVVEEVSPVHFPVEDLSSYPLLEDYP